MKQEPKEKAQFFIISAVIIASILLIVSRSFSDFGSIDLSRQSEASELEYIPMIKKSLNSSIGECDRMEEDISETEYFLWRKLLDQGIELSAKHQIISCGKARFSFNLSGRDFFSSTEFWYP